MMPNRLNNFRRSAKDLAASLLCNSGIQNISFFVRKYGYHPLILYYHRVSDSDGGLHHYPELVVSPENFDRQMKFLRDHYVPMPVEELVDRLRLGAPIPSRAVGVTFDDGYADNFTHAFPILRKYDIPATIFVTTAHIGSDKLLWWDRVGVIGARIRKERPSAIPCENGKVPEEIRRVLLRSLRDGRCVSMVVDLLKKYGVGERLKIVTELEKGMDAEYGPVTTPRLFMSTDELLEMSGNGIAFGSHTHTHLVLTEGDEDQARTELKESRIILEDVLGRRVRGFSYPDGMLNERIMNYVRDEGYDFGVQTGRFARQYSGIYALARKKVKESASVDRHGEFSASLFAMELALVNDFLFGRNLRRKNPYGKEL